MKRCFPQFVAKTTTMDWARPFVPISKQFPRWISHVFPGLTASCSIYWQPTLRTRQKTHRDLKRLPACSLSKSLKTSFPSDTETSRISVLNALTTRRLLFGSYEIIYPLLIPHQESYLGNQHTKLAINC